MSNTVSDEDSYFEFGIAMMLIKDTKLDLSKNMRLGNGTWF